MGAVQTAAAPPHRGEHRASATEGPPRPSWPARRRPPPAVWLPAAHPARPDRPPGPWNPGHREDRRQKYVCGLANLRRYTLEAVAPVSAGQLDRLGRAAIRTIRSLRRSGPAAPVRRRGRGRDRFTLRSTATASTGPLVARSPTRPCGHTALLVFTFAPRGAAARHRRVPPPGRPGGEPIPRRPPSRPGGDGARRLQRLPVRHGAPGGGRGAAVPDLPAAGGADRCGGLPDRPALFDRFAATRPAT